MTNRTGAALRSLGGRLSRTKHIPKGDLTTNLKRCLNTFDITMIGVGHMIGAGIFVTTGEVMRKLAGPSTTISYIISGLAALLSALCYAEFGARYPKAGSAYTYAYVGCGEIWAFIIGWNIILEHVLSAAAVGRTFAGYVDDLAGMAVSNWTIEHVRPWPWNTVPLEVHGSNSTSLEICLDSDAAVIAGSLIGKYPDFISVAIVLCSAVFVGIGSKAASNFNSVFSLANLLVIIFVVGYGIFKFADFSNWNKFFPCGVNGVLAGASKCFFAYVGFDGLATAGEEAKNPTKMIPRATYYSMAIVTTCYVLMSGTLSLMVPYYQLPDSSVYSKVFTQLGAPQWISLVIAIGALLGILTSLVGALFSLPRSVYAMAEDGLIFGWWAKVNPWTKTPLNATITFTILAAIIAMTFDLDALVDFLSIGTILAYTIVAAALIMLRYRPHPVENNPEVMDQGGRIRRNIPILSARLEHMKPGSSILYTLIVMICAFTGIGVLIATSYIKYPFGTGLMAIFAFVSICCVLFIDAHQQNSMDLDYKVFLVPYLPSVSLLINILMMTQLTLMTWIRLFVWMALGLAIYLIYGMSHSKEEVNWRNKRRLMAEQKASGKSKDRENYWRVTDISLADTSPTLYKEAWSDANNVDPNVDQKDGDSHSQVWILDTIPIKHDVLGTVGCWKGSNFTRIGGLRVSMMEYESGDGVDDEFLNASVTNKAGDFKVFGHDNEVIQYSAFYLSVMLSCNFILREPVFDGCLKIDTNEPIRNQCIGDPATKFLFKPLHIKDPRKMYWPGFGGDGSPNVCYLDIDIGELKPYFLRGGSGNDFKPQTEFEKSTLRRQYLAPKRPNCTIVEEKYTVPMLEVIRTTFE